MKTCNGCLAQFEIPAEDLLFYEKVKAPVPNYCPFCRMQRRLARRNERTLYKRLCDLCGKDTVSIYPPKAPHSGGQALPFPVYCSPCWWSDNWNAKELALEYDPARPFLEQFAKLQNKVPRIALLNISSTNSDYTNNSGYNKNCYLLFAAEKNEDCFYGRLVQNCRSVVDCGWVYESEKCYECVDCMKCFNCLWCERCQSSTDLLFCFDARDSNNCILSSNLRHASYMIENVKGTKEEFEKRKKEILSSPEKLAETKKKFAVMKAKTIVKFAYQTKCARATGDYLYNCHNSHDLFDTRNAKDCGYLADVEDPTDCLDMNNAYFKPELCLDIMGVLQTYNCKYSSYIFHSSDLEYCDSCYNSESCFGSIGLRKANYCILNRQYSREEYLALKEKIKNQMSKNVEYGNFFPPALSPHGYNETLGMDYAPLSRDKAIQKGFRWEDSATGTFGKEDGKTIFACVDCKKNFRFTPGEISFYEQMGLPRPERDFECRHRARSNARTPRELWRRNCMKENCPNEFETSYSPPTPAKGGVGAPTEASGPTVYCEQHYNAEVV